MTRRTATKRDYIRIFAAGTVLVGLAVTSLWAWV